MQRSFYYFLPEYTEQQKIAEILTTVDDKIEIIDQQIEQTQELKKGLMQKLLTGEYKIEDGKIVKRNEAFKDSELGKIPESWEVSTLLDVSIKEKYPIVDGPFGSNLKTEHYRNSGIPIITSGYVTEGRFYAENYLYVDVEKFEKEKRSTVKGGDIVMAKIGARCGRSAILPLEHEVSILSGNALKISIDKNNSTDFYWQLLTYFYDTGIIDKLRTTGAQPAISISSLKKLKVPLPSQNEQHIIAELLTSIECKVEILNNKKSEYTKLKKGLMQKLLTGKIRVKV